MKKFDILIISLLVIAVVYLITYFTVCSIKSFSDNTHLQFIVSGIIAASIGYFFIRYLKKK